MKRAGLCRDEVRQPARMFPGEAPSQTVAVVGIAAASVSLADGCFKRLAYPV